MKYREVIALAHRDLLRSDPRAVILGAGTTNSTFLFGTTKLAFDEFPDRVIETPLSENMLTGACVGMAVEGWHPVFIHARADFLTLSMEHLINTAAKWAYVHRGQQLPMIVEAIIGQGWGQGPQHSQLGAPWLANVPGLELWMPATAEGVHKGTTFAGRPIVTIWHRRLFETDVGNVASPTNQWARPEIQIWGVSAAFLDAIAAEELLYNAGIRAQSVPIESIPRTDMSREQPEGCVLIVEPGPTTSGVSAELMAQLLEAWPQVRAKRIGAVPTPCPTSYTLERAWYPSVGQIVNAAYELLGRTPPTIPTGTDVNNVFVPAGGPF